MQNRLDDVNDLLNNKILIFSLKLKT